MLHDRLLSTGFESGVYIRDPLLFWKFRRSQRFKILNSSPSEYTINSRGLRGREFTIKPKEGVIRIICLGDSITFGLGVNHEDAYPQELENLLNTGMSPQKFEVINAGILGHSSLQGLRFLKKEILNYHPGIITVCYGQNDFDWPFPINKVDKQIQIQPSLIVRLQNFINISKVYQLLSKVLLTVRLKIDNSGQIFSYALHSQRVSEEDMADNLSEMIDTAEANGIILLLINATGGRAAEVIEFTANKKSVPFVNAGIIKERDRHLLIDGCHPNHEGHKVIAGLIYEKLLENGILNSGRE